MDDQHSARPDTDTGIGTGIGAPEGETKHAVAAPAPSEQGIGESYTPPKPPRARVSDAPLDDTPLDNASLADAPTDQGESAGDTLTRKKDYLAGFLAQTPPAIGAGEPGGELYEGVIEALKDIFDPEIPVNIYDLGLIYGVEISPEADVAITMTLTTPHCPVAETMPGEIELRVGSLPGVRDAQVNVTWDPPWDPSKMTDEARLELGML